MKKLFNSLSLEEKAEFFVRCQKLLIQHHPDSGFVVRESNLDSVVDSFVDQINRYQGYCYVNDNACVLWNYVLITDPQNAAKSLQDNAYKAPHPDYNGVSMDFVACRQISDVLSFIRQYDEDRIQYLLSVKGGRAKLLRKEDLIKGLGL